MQILSARIFSRGNQAEPTLGLVADEWLDSLSATVKYSTYSVYSSIAEKYIPQALRSKPVSSVTAGDIGRLLNEAEHPPGREALSASRMHTICTVVDAILSFARQKGLKAVTCNYGRRRANPAKHEIDPLTQEEQAALERWLLEHMDNSSLGVLICLYTGLRLGEICAMKWGDVSFAGSSLKVQRTVQRVKAPGAGPGNPRTCLAFDSPKSASANRLVPLPQFLLELMAPMRGTDAAFILTGSEQRCIDPRTYQNRFYAILRASGVRRVSFHTLRHTFATGCIDVGGDPKTLCEILGHSDVGITLNVYVHPSVPAKRDLVERLSSRSGHPASE